jgi:hypothetical protein
MECFKRKGKEWKGKDRKSPPHFPRRWTKVCKEEAYMGLLNA